jgi:hypothetical protein
MRLSCLPALLLAPPSVELQRRTAAAATPITGPQDTPCGTDADGHSLPAVEGRLGPTVTAVQVSRPMLPCAAVEAAMSAAAVAALLAAMRSLLRAALASAISTLCLYTHTGLNSKHPVRAQPVTPFAPGRSRRQAAVCLGQQAALSPVQLQAGS